MILRKIVILRLVSAGLLLTIDLIKLTYFSDQMPLELLLLIIGCIACVLEFMPVKKYPHTNIQRIQKVMNGITQKTPSG